MKKKKLNNQLYSKIRIRIRNKKIRIPNQDPDPDPAQNNSGSSTLVITDSAQHGSCSPLSLASSPAYVADTALLPLPLTIPLSCMVLLTSLNSSVINFPQPILPARVSPLTYPNFVPFISLFSTYSPSVLSRWLQSEQLACFHQSRIFVRGFIFLLFSEEFFFYLRGGDIS